MKKDNNIISVLEVFENAANKQAEATEIGDYKQGNKCYKEIFKAVSYLKKENQIHSLMSFLYHPSIGVRLWASTFLLDTCEEKAKITLQEIVKTQGILSFIAETTLKEWEEGNLKI